MLAVRWPYTGGDKADPVSRYVHLNATLTRHSRYGRPEISVTFLNKHPLERENLGYAVLPGGQGGFGTVGHHGGDALIKD